MTHKEKLDKVLYLLYNHKFSGRQYPISEIMRTGNLAYEGEEPRIIAKRLHDDGLVKATFTKDGALVKLTSSGIEYCEEESYSLPGKPIINIYSISNSSYASIVVGNQNTINYSSSELIKNKIKEIRTLISENQELTEALVREIGECLDELDEKISNKRKVPTTLLKGLLSSTADFATIYPHVISLSELFKS